MTALHSAPETKATGDIAGAFNDLTFAFSEYKATNDERLAQIERKSSADVLTEEKLSRIERSLDEATKRFDRLSLAARRPALGGETKASHAETEHKAAFEAYVRAGEADGLKRLEMKALSAGSGPDGGYLVPQNAEREILRRMAAVSPVRAIASVRPVSTNAFKKAFSSTGPATGWTAEAGSRVTTNSQVLQDLTFPTFEIYAQPAATQTLLDDASVDIESWIAEEVEVAFAEQEGAAFIAGNGTDRPKGILSYTQVANASWTWGNVGYLATGTSGAFPASNPSDVLVDLVYALKAGYRQNGAFLMNRKTQSVVRKFKDTTGAYLWQPPATIGAPATLMNFPVVEAEDMPDIAAGSASIAFGDFRRGYLIIDRMGIRILRDPFSSKPYVLFYTTKRVGGGVQDFEAIKLLKFAVS